LDQAAFFIEGAFALAMVIMDLNQCAVFVIDKGFMGGFVWIIRIRGGSFL